MCVSDFIFPNIDFGINTPVLNVNNMFDDCIIYIFGNYIDNFTINVLPLISKKFILITGVSDFIIPYHTEPPKNKISNILLSNINLVAWYGLNKTENHPKLYHLPIGIPRSLPFVEIGGKNKEIPYMGWYRTYHGRNIVKQTIDNLMKNKTIMGVIKSKYNCDKVLYIRYTTENSKYSKIEKNKNFRLKLDKYIEKSEFTKKKGLKNWVENIKEVQKYKFVLEPFGACIDGYRLWESILVGTIPIVFDSPIIELYKDLPIVIIKNFKEINLNNLNKQYNQIISKTDYNFNKLNIDYWIEKIKKHKTN